jgi:hypothetical protein
MLITPLLTPSTEYRERGQRELLFPTPGFQKTTHLICPEVYFQTEKTVFVQKYTSKRHKNCIFFFSFRKYTSEVTLGVGKEAPWTNACFQITDPIFRRHTFRRKKLFLSKSILPNDIKTVYFFFLPEIYFQSDFGGGKRSSFNKCMLPNNRFRLGFDTILESIG